MKMKTATETARKYKTKRCREDVFCTVFFVVGEIRNMKRLFTEKPKQSICSEKIEIFNGFIEKHNGGK